MTESTPPLVGRESERAAIDGALQALDSGKGAIVAVEGEPGIGKSRLLAHLSAAAGAAGLTVLSGRASEFEMDLPYALWTDALDRHLADAGERRLSPPRAGRPRGPRRGAARARRRSPQRRRRATGTAPTARCAICWSVWRLHGRWCSAWTTSTGPTRRPPRGSRPW